MSARADILNRVRTALGERATATQAIPRDYRHTTDDDLTTFFDRLAHYEATSHLVDEADLEHKVREILGERRIVTPAGIPDAWTSAIEPLHDDPPLDAHDLDASDGVITTCALAIAQTGTIILDGGPGMGRRALTLLPDYHLCIVRQDQIVSCVPEAVRSLEDPTRPLTFVSGPSATVDIEMVRVRGVHGPRRLEVVVATQANTDPAP
ncbi:MAG TPA: lactate utilization protein C [Solirubrobacteraceae bacterium]